MAQAAFGVRVQLADETFGNFLERARAQESRQFSFANAVFDGVGVTGQKRAIRRQRNRRKRAHVAAGLFSKLVYPAFIVHMGIIGTFLFALLWIAWSRYYKPNSLYWRFITCALGFSLFFHATDGLHAAWIDLHKPYSSSKAAGVFLKQEYPDAIVICEPEVFGESLVYYTNNKIYLVRERRFSQWVDFVRPFNRSVTLSELMSASAQLQRVTGKVVLVSLPKNEEGLGPGHFNWSYGRALEINQEEVKRFRVDFAEVGGFTEGEETYVFLKGDRIHCEVFPGSRSMA